MKKSIILVIALINFCEASEHINLDNIETFWIWVALFTLGFIGIIILFFSSKQMLHMQKIHQEMFQNKIDMEQKQALFLATISENIHNMAKEALEKNIISSEQNMIYNSHSNSDTLENKMKNNLLDATHDLIDFLQLKSKKVEIINEKFNLNNVLNEVSGSICSQFSGSKIELIFDIDNNIPKLLIGDSLHLGQVLYNILEHRMNSLNDEELELKISMFQSHNINIELQFQFIDKGPGMTKDELENLFIPYYVEETKEYLGLSTFVARQLVEMMKGELSIQSDISKGSTFTLTLPFEEAEENDQRKYRLKEKNLINKKVLIVDSSYTSGLAIKKMFSYFKHDVKVMEKETFIVNLPNLRQYDMVVLSDELLNFKTLDYLKKIKENTNIKVISLNALLRVAQNQSEANRVIDFIMLKPLNQERIYEMIIQLYNNNDLLIEKNKNNEVNILGAKIFKSNIKETKNITQKNFKDFKDKKLLIVEDNIINQKVLINLLHKSGMQISIANNGKEAVAIVKEGKENFDLVLMDINMPVMDGYAATQAIRYEQKFNNLPIVAFTALVLDTEIQKMFSCGINAFLSKPLNIGKLYTAMEMYLSEKNDIAFESKNIKLEKLDIYPGLNIKNGIKHANNNESLYIEVLKEFIAAYGESDKVVETLVVEHRYEQLKMLCLDMKGLSSTIGAEEIHLEVSEIYKYLLYKKYQILPNYIKIYKRLLIELNKSINLYLKER